jgi:hypothetical protein
MVTHPKVKDAMTFWPLKEIGQKPAFSGTALWAWSSTIDPHLMWELSYDFRRTKGTHDG